LVTGGWVLVFGFVAGFVCGWVCVGVVFVLVGVVFVLVGVVLVAVEVVCAGFGLEWQSCWASSATVEAP
jgi:hypothetical protein